MGAGLVAPCLAGPALWLVAAVLVGGQACAEDAPKIDARTVMERINQAYEALNAQGRRVTMEYRTTIRAPGKPDVHLSGTAVALQKDRKIRFEQAEGAYRTAVRAKGKADADRPGGDLLWINDGRLLWWRYKEPDADPERGCGVREDYVDFSRMPKEYGPKWTQPMMAAELPEEFLGHDFVLSQQVLQGKPVYVLRSEGRIPLSPDSSMGVTLWVDPKSYLVLRMENDDAWHPAPGIEAYTEGEYDITYEFGVEIPDSAFQIEIGKRAEDITAVVSRKIRDKLEWQGKLPKSAEPLPAPAVQLDQREWRCPPIG
jgi:hypothetical protein